jgi:outer membrane protein TolC
MIRPKIKLMLMITIPMLLAINIFAQEKLALTVDQAVDLGLQNSKTLHSSLMKVKGADARVSELNAARLPALRLSGYYRKLSSVDPFSVTIPGLPPIVISPSILDNYSATLTLSQPLFMGFRLKSNADIAEYSADATNQDYNKDRSELMFNIKNSYWSLFKAFEFKKVMDETVDQIKAHVEDAKNLLKAGMMTQNDVLKLDVQLSNTMYQQVDADNAVKLAAVALDNVLGISLNTQIEIISAPNMVPKEYDSLNKLVDQAVKLRAEVKSAESRVKAGEAGVTMAQSSWYPQISLVADYLYARPNSRIFPTRDQFDGTWDAGVNVSLNIWDWLTTAHQTEQAKSQLSQAVDAAGIIKDGITLEVTQNYLSFNQSKRKIDISKLAVDQAEESMKVTSDKFKNGLAQSSDIVDSETALINARTNYTNSIVDFELAKAKLDKSIGQ